MISSQPSLEWETQKKELMDDYDLNFVFGEHGNSSSFVFDRNGGVIRRVLGGFERKGTVYFAHIDNIFDDIKEASRAEDVRIAV